jgi:DNA polymerase III subunit delta'
MSAWAPVLGARVVEGLRRQMAAGEVTQAWLLLGPPGSGKGAVADAMAAALNCRIAPRSGCGTCSSCERILRRRHPDVHNLAPEGSVIPVDVIREAVLPEAARSPFEGTTKVFVIEDADLMNEPAQNALLKTLEEPQADTVFILTSEHEEELLDTIRSRCRAVRLEAVPEDRLVELLQEEGASKEWARVAARLSEGDVARARPLVLDPAGADRARLWASIPSRLRSAADALDVAAEIHDQARGAGRDHARVQREEIEELAVAMGEGRGTATARNALATRHRRETRRLEEAVMAEALGSLAAFYRDVVAFRAGRAEIVAHLDKSGALEAWAASTVNDARLLAAAERCSRAVAALTQNANVVLTLESALTSIVRLVAPPVAGDPVTGG